MIGRLPIFLGLLCAFWFCASAAEARKIALVIGNQKYTHLESLEKSAADAGSRPPL